MFKLSIITINYNNLEGLKRTVLSVISQTWKDFEYIIIDGDSTDGSKEYLDSQSEFFNYWVSEKDSGIFNAMNKGIKVATGQYFLFLNSGDHLFSDVVLEKANVLLSNNDLICFDIQKVSQGFSWISKPPSELCFSDLYLGSLPHQSTFIKNELFNLIGLYDENFRIASDWKFFILALFKFNCSYLKVDQTLATFYLDGISSTEDFSVERYSVMKEYFNGFIFDYEELIENKKFIHTNRFKMLKEIEKTKFGMKMVSFFFRIYIVLISKNKLKDILNSK